jgi:hypothetical protein
VGDEHDLAQVVDPDQEAQGILERTALEERGQAAGKARRAAGNGEAVVARQPQALV